MTRPGIEPRSPGPLARTLWNRNGTWMSRLYNNNDNKILKALWNTRYPLSPGQNIRQSVNLEDTKWMFSSGFWWSRGPLKSARILRRVQANLIDTQGYCKKSEKVMETMKVTSYVNCDWCSLEQSQKRLGNLKRLGRTGDKRKNQDHLDHSTVKTN